MTHVAPETTSIIDSKSISKDGGRTTYRGLVKVEEGAHNVKSHVRCDALILDEDSRSDTYPYMEIEEKDARIGHEATVSKVGDDQLFYLMSRGLTEQQATAMIVNGFIEPIVKTLPMEYAVELSPPDRAQHGRSGRLTARMTAFTPEAARALGGPDWLVERRRRCGRAARRRSPGRRDAEEIWRYSRIDELDLDRFRPPSRDELGEPGRRSRRRAAARVAAEAGERAGLVVVRDGRVVHHELDPTARREGRSRLRPRHVRRGRRRRRCWGRARRLRPTRSPSCTTRSSPEARSSRSRPVSSSTSRSSCCTGPRARAWRRSRTRWLPPRRAPRSRSSTASAHPRSAPPVISSTPWSSSSSATTPGFGTCRSRSTGRTRGRSRCQRAHVGRDATLRLVGGRARRRLCATAQRVAARGRQRRERPPRRLLRRRHTRCSTSARSRTTTPRGTRSDLLFKGAVEDQAHSVYSGLIRLRPDARKGGREPDEPQPRADRRRRGRLDPQPRDRGQRREVLARDRRSGPIDEDQLYYLESRGVPPAEAERLIVLGFFDDVLDRLPIPTLAACRSGAPWSRRSSTARGRDLRVCSVKDVEAGSARRFDVDGQRLCVVRIGDDFYVIDDTCSHADYSLAEGDVWEDEREIECPKHGSTFSLETGEPATLPATQPVHVYDVEIDGDDVVVTMTREHVADRGPAGRRRRPGDPARRRPRGRLGRGPRADGPERLGEVDAGARAHGPPRVRDPRRLRHARRSRSSSACRRGSAPPTGLFLAMQYPVEVPGVRLVRPPRRRHPWSRRRARTD